MTSTVTRPSTRRPTRTKTIGLAAIGCGGRLRYLLGKLLPLDQRLQLHSVCDPLPASVDAARQALNPELSACTNYQQMLADPAVDWVLIGSPNSLHKEHALAALAAGKHVFCEKPLATTLADCVALQKAWKKSNRLFCIGFTLRYSPHYQAIAKAINSGAIGSIVSVEFNETLSFRHGGHIFSDWRRLRENSGGHLLEKCCHDIDLANWFVGSLAEKVASFGGNNVFVPSNARLLRKWGKNKNGTQPYRDWQQPGWVDPFRGDHNVIDNQVAILQYGNGARATFHTNCHAGIPERRMYIVGTLGAIRADVLTGQIQMGLGYRQEMQDLSSQAKGGHGGGDDYLAGELHQAMTRGIQPRSGLDEGLKSAVTCFAIDQAMAQSKVVDLAPMWRKVGLAAVAAM